MIIISNTSKQHRRFYYRQIGRTQNSFVDVPSGQQRQIGKDFGTQDEEFVITQLRSYGAREKGEAGKKADPRFHGIVFTTDKPMTEDQILDAAEKTTEGTEILAAQESIKSAMGADEAVNEKGSGSRRSKETTVEVIAQDPTGKKIKGGIDTSITVTPSGDKATLPGRG